MLYSGETTFLASMLSSSLPLLSCCQLFSKSAQPMPRLILSLSFSLTLSLPLSQRQFKGVCVRLVPIRSSSLFSRHWQPAIWDPLGLITPPLDSLTMHPPLLLLSSPLLRSLLFVSSHLEMHMKIWACTHTCYARAKKRYTLIIFL